MSFEPGILPLIKPNSILGIEISRNLAETRYQVSSSSPYWPQLDTWYRGSTQISLNGHQLYTWYRGDASIGLNSIHGIDLCLNAAQIDKFSPTRYQVSSWATLCVISILGIEIRPVEASTRYQVSNWCLYGGKVDTGYRVDTSTDLISILSIEFTPLRGSTRYQVSICSSIWEQLDTWHRVGSSVKEPIMYVCTIRVRLTWTRTSRASLMP